MHEEGSGFSATSAIKHLLFAIVVGLVTGAASMALCLSVGVAFDAFSIVPWLVWLLPISGILQLLLYRAFKLPLGLSTDHIVRKIRADKRISYLLAPGILITTCMSVICGASVGKEAGALQMGSSLGSLIAKPFKLKRVFRKDDPDPLQGYAGAVGMAACFSALFFAPLGSCMFVLELARFKKSVAKHVLTILVSCFVAYGVACLTGIGDVIAKVAIPEISWPVAGQCILVGCLASMAGAAFAFLIRMVRKASLVIYPNRFVWVVVGGLVFAVLVTFFGWDAFCGTGGDQLNAALAGSFGAWDFAIKMLLTLICLGLWFKGGEIMPSFCIGGLLGASTTYMTSGSPEFAAAVGVMSFFAAFSRCPAAAFLMGCEIFGWGMAPYLLIGISIAFVLGRPEGMYGKLAFGMSRKLKRKSSAVDVRPGV